MQPQSSPDFYAHPAAAHPAAAARPAAASPSDSPATAPHPTLPSTLEEEVSRWMSEALFGCYND